MSAIKTIARRLGAPLMLAALAACASDAQDIGPLKTRETAYGTVLADARGMTLYTAASDGEGVSRCVQACAQAWPPLLAGTDAKPNGRLTLVARDDGGRQWAWNGRPLYLWSRDQSPGDVAGHNHGDVWRVARP